MSAICREVSGLAADAAAEMSDSGVRGAPAGSDARSDSSGSSSSGGDESDEESDEDEDADLDEGALLEEDLEDVDDETLDQYRY